MLSGDNSILQKTTNAKTKTTHATVVEQMQLEVNAYTIDKATGTYSNTLIDYLKLKTIISDITSEENKWLINVTTLLESNQSIGTGTYPNDVYVLEKDTTESYKVMYYETGTSDALILGSLIDSNNSLSDPTEKFQRYSVTIEKMDRVKNKCDNWIIYKWRKN